MAGTIVEIETPYGLLSLDTTSDAKMAQALKNGHYPNDDLIQLARHFLDPESVVVDIGAHIGTFAVAVAGFAKVVAFEPAPQTFALLRQNAARSPGEISVYNKGLAAVSGSAHVIARNDSNAGSQTLAPGGEVVISTLDAEVEYADFIKIDVEGMELQVLEGGVKLIERARPVVFFEVNLSQLRSHAASPRLLQRYFAQRGYRLFYPLFKNGVLTLGLVGSATLLTALLAPRSWLLHSDSAPFDLIAVPQERALPLSAVSFGSVFWQALEHNLRVKANRLRRVVRSV